MGRLTSCVHKKGRSRLKPTPPVYSRHAFRVSIAAAGAILTIEGTAVLVYIARVFVAATLTGWVGHTVRVVAICCEIAVVVDAVRAIRFGARRCSAIRGAVALILTRITGEVPTNRRWSAIHLAVEAVLVTLAHGVAAAEGGTSTGRRVGATERAGAARWIAARQRVLAIAVAAAEPPAGSSVLLAVAIG